jgi:DNA-binding protein YbaB
MKDLIEALNIFLKYTEEVYPTCEHDVLYVQVNPNLVTMEDKNRLHELGFEPGDNCFESFKFGS